MAISNHTPIQLPLPFDNTITIPLTQGQITIISIEDADLAELKWFAQFNWSYMGGKFVASRHTPSINGKRSLEFLHRVILSRMLGRPLLRSELVDHEHGNPLDNRRSELRLATHGQNSMNRGKQSNNTSGYKGVSWKKGNNKWCAQIEINGKKKYIGLFDDPAEAYAAYCKAAIELHGEFVNLG